MNLVISAFLITVGVGLGFLALTAIAFVGQVVMIVVLERLERSRR